MVSQLLIKRSLLRFRTMNCIGGKENNMSGTSPSFV